MKQILKIVACTAFLAIASTTLAKEITLFVHGTNPPGVDIKRKIFGGYIPKNIKCATELTDSNHPHEVISALCTGSYPLTSKDQLYFFGWNGFFPIQREQETQRLYDELMLFIRNNNKITKKKPLHIRLFTHSHGGNVALYLLNLIDKNKNPIIIDELILMGCPVQKVTKEYIHAQCVKKIYNFYSSGDEIQIVDPQGLYPESHQNNTANLPSLFSKRMFETKQNNLWQIETTLDGKDMGHMDFVSPLFLLSMAQIIEELKTHDSGNICLNVVTTEKKPIEHINLKIKK